MEAILQLVSFPGFVIGLLLGGWVGWALGIRDPYLLGLMAVGGAGLGCLAEYWISRRFFPVRKTAIPTESEDKGIRWDA